MHWGQHWPGLVTGREQEAGGQRTGAHVTVPWTHVQRWQGSEEEEEEVLKVCL